MDAIQETFEGPQRDPEKMSSFGSILRNQFSLNKSYRQSKELEWVESLRQYKGLYDPDVKIDPNNSKVYPKLTRSKVNMVLSRLHEMLFPETDKNFEIKPTPEPKIAKETVAEIANLLIRQAMAEFEQQQEEYESMVQQGQQGPPPQMVAPTNEDLRMAIMDYAQKACEKMSNVIDDQLTEMDYPEETKKVLGSGLRYGTGIMKGPMINKRTKRKWEQDDTGEFSELVDSEDVPYLSFVRVWDWYPDMSTTEPDKMDGSFERHVMTKHDLRQLIKREDFFGDVIRKYMEEHPNGDYMPEPWEVELQQIEVEAGTGKSTSVSGTVKQQGSARAMGTKYEVLEYWGFVDGQDMEACGIKVDDVTLEYEANVWLLGHEPIKVALYDKARGIYKIFYYEKDETSIFGEGLARIMRHSQIAISSAARMTLDNGACVSGPNVEVNTSLIVPGSDISSIYPRKIWYREGRGVEAQYPAVRDIQFDSHIQELINLIHEFKQFGDEETCLPTWMIGQPAPNETAQGTSMRMSSITISVKDVVRNFDKFTEHVMRDLYAWNMEFNPRSDIKGDFSVKAKGVSSLVMKEVRMQAMNQLAQTMTPEDWAYVPRREFLQARFKDHDLKVKLRTEEEAAKYISEHQDQRMQALAYENMAVENQYKKAQTMGQLAKAKKMNIEAMKDSQTPPETPPAATDPRIVEGELALQNAKLEDQRAATRRAEEKHGADLSAQDLKNRINIASTAAKSESDIENKRKITNSVIRTKESMARSKQKQPRGGQNR